MAIEVDNELDIEWFDDDDVTSDIWKEITSYFPAVPRVLAESDEPWSVVSKKLDAMLPHVDVKVSVAGWTVYCGDEILRFIERPQAVVA